MTGVPKSFSTPTTAANKLKTTPVDTLPYFDHEDGFRLFPIGVTVLLMWTLIMLYLLREVWCNAGIKETNLNISNGSKKPTSGASKRQSRATLSPINTMSPVYMEQSSTRLEELSASHLSVPNSVHTQSSVRSSTRSHKWHRSAASLRHDYQRLTPPQWRRYNRVRSSRKSSINRFTTTVQLELLNYTQLSESGSDSVFDDHVVNESTC